MFETSTKSLLPLTRIQTEGDSPFKQPTSHKYLPSAHLSWLSINIQEILGNFYLILIFFYFYLIKIFLFKCFYFNFIILILLLFLFNLNLIFFFFSFNFIFIFICLQYVSPHILTIMQPCGYIKNNYTFCILSLRVFTLYIMILSTSV